MVEKLFSKYQRGKEKKILPVVEKILEIPTGKRKLGAWLRKFSKYQHAHPILRKNLGGLYVHVPCLL